LSKLIRTARRLNSVFRGDVIESINRQPVRNVAEFNRLATQAKGQTLLRINRQGNGVFVVISRTKAA